jgi:hypothetical protein
MLKNSLALNEIQANQLDPNDINTALVPSIDPMCLINGEESLEKTNAYRSGVNQPLLQILNNQNNINYCNRTITLYLTLKGLYSYTIDFDRGGIDSRIAQVNFNNALTALGS